MKRCTLSWLLIPVGLLVAWVFLKWSSPSIVWDPCRLPVECARLDVPTDYEHPNAGTISLTLRRKRAEDPARRIGVLLWNNGGPGGESIGRFVGDVVTIRDQLPEVYARFDLVSFDWRGVGLSSHPPCLTRLDTVLRGYPGGLNPVERAALAEEVLTECRHGPDGALVDHMDSTTVAHDLDRIRVGLGEDRLNFIGYSYGSKLGAIYAADFPHRVRAIILDSAGLVPPPTKASGEQLLELDEVEVRRFLRDCEARPNCPFKRGAAASLDESFQLVMRKIDDDHAGRPGAGPGETLSPFDAWTAILEGLAAKEDDSIAKALVELASGRAEALSHLAHQELIGFDTAAQWLIRCLDEPPGDGVQVARPATIAAERDPLLRPSLGSSIPLRNCGARGVPRSLNASGASPLLVLNSRWDSSTPLENAERFVNELGNGSYLVVYEGEGHGVLRRSPCARKLASSFLIDPSEPISISSCPAEATGPE